MLKQKIIIGCWLVCSSLLSQAQGKFYTKSGKITFFSSTSMEDIEAINKTVITLLNTQTGDLQFAVLMKGFEFKKALMQEHFNRDYVESNKFPKAEFKGQLTNNSDINYTTNGTYTAKAKGKLTIHGQTKDIETTGTITVKDGKLLLNSFFNVLVADYKINIPRLYRDNISKSIKVTVDCSLVAL
ncbi:MAG: YceI family protein [Chitinophagaceae bacterium]|nr:YceI family protein [Chitinophagaceae bacterium]